MVRVSYFDKHCLVCFFVSYLINVCTSHPNYFITTPWEQLSSLRYADLPRIVYGICWKISLQSLSTMCGQLKIKGYILDCSGLRSIGITGAMLPILRKWRFICLKRLGHEYDVPYQKHIFQGSIKGMHPDQQFMNSHSHNN